MKTKYAGDLCNRRILLSITQPFRHDLCLDSTRHHVVFLQPIKSCYSKYFRSTISNQTKKNTGNRESRLGYLLQRKASEKDVQFYETFFSSNVPELRRISSILEKRFFAISVVYVKKEKNQYYSKNFEVFKTFK